jgi:signal transduction histidine kinase/ligand-binding sensor domain-containing protein
LKRFGACAGALLQCCAAWSQNSEPTLRQLNHRVFTSADGVPSDIYAVAQTSDGTLWIGGRAGLTRFDGIRFVPYPGPSDPPLPTTNISSLLAAPGGGLWIGFRFGGAGFLKAGRLTRYGEREGMPDGSIEQFAWDRDGSLWAAARLGLGHFKDGRWERVTEERELGAPYGVLVDPVGALWVATTDGLFSRGTAEKQFHKVEISASFGSGGTVLVASPDGRIFGASTTHELISIDRPTGPRPSRIVSVPGISRGPLLFDDEGNLWAADVNSDAILRVPSADLTREGQPDLHGHAERYSRAEGLNSGRVMGVIEDHERNIWVATNAGLERFSRSNVVGEVAPPCSQGFVQAAVLAAGDAGALWIACLEGSSGYVDEIRGGAVVSHQITPGFNAAFRDSRGTVWFGGQTDIGHLERGRIVTIPLPEQVRGRPVQALARDGSGAMWVSMSRRSVFRFLDGEWSEYGGLDALPRGYPLVETTDSDGAVWFGYRDNQIARVNGRTVQLFDTTQGLRVGNVLAILAEAGEVWVGGELGLARFDGRRFTTLNSAFGSPLRGLSGIVRARNGDLWLNGIAGIVHIDQQEIGRARTDPAHRVVCETFDYLDGVPGAAVQVRPQPSAIATTDGHIWFSMTGGIVSIDATHLSHNTLPPPVTIWSVTSGSKRYPIVGENLQLPVHTTGLQIEYSAGSLTVPERVRFRYKLEGSDLDWQDVGAHREATYTNLGPGRYTFRVIAANNNGVWNKTGASIDFAILPAFYETRWFYALCVLAFMAILAALYRMRMRQVAAQVRDRLEARLTERERIARELHDTLLQGMQGLIWRFQAATDRIPPEESARHLMEEALDRADSLLGESRDRVKDLRPSMHTGADFGQVIAVEGEQFSQLHRAQFRVSVEGSARELHPIVREEGFMIAREALGNAFRHSGAANIEVELTYGDRALHVRIRDDGQGISPNVLDSGKPGHFGLIGMRERARKLGATLEIWSKAGAGTEIELRVPADVAYRRPQKVKGGPRSWFASLQSSVH